MNDFYDLTAEPALQSFPWDPVYHGLALSHKSVTTFYGDDHTTKYQSTVFDFPDRNSWRWHNVLKHGTDIEGFNVNLNSFAGENWWARIAEPGIWEATKNASYFGRMYEWIRASGLFNSTGRILFFIQLAGQGTPEHTDFDPLPLPPHLQKPTEFIWLTPPDNPKRMKVGGKEVPWACWFNHFVPHSTEPLHRPQWSLRIDGVFSEDFRRRIHDGLSVRSS